MVTSEMVKQNGTGGSRTGATLVVNVGAQDHLRDSPAKIGSAMSRASKVGKHLLDGLHQHVSRTQS